MLISVKSPTEAVITCAVVFLASIPFLIEIAFLCHILLVKRNELGLSTLLATQSLLQEASVAVRGEAQKLRACTELLYQKLFGYK